MYDLINQFAQTVVSAIPPDHVTEYEWLLQNVDRVTMPDYQERYRRYWAMGVARLNAAFYATYFNELSLAMRQAPSLQVLSQTLHVASTNSKGRQSLQFSFATKLLHMTNQQLPIYASEVAAFYFFQEPEIKKPKEPQDLQRRIGVFVTFHDFLRQEYARVFKNNLLATAIQEFRVRLKPQRFTDAKIVDSLIWRFVGLLWKGALMNGIVTYR